MSRVSTLSEAEAFPATPQRVGPSRSTIVLIALCAACAACGQSSPPPPVVTPPAGTETITGTERIGWDQPAPNLAELATFRYAIYVDGTRSELAGVSCATSATASGFPCTALLPAMAAGAHTLELASFVVDGGVLESARSAALRVMVVR